MGYLADEPLGDALDEAGLDAAGKSLRDQQRKAQAIDRDLPDNTGIDYTHGDLEADAADYSKAWKEMAKQAYGGTVTGRTTSPDNAATLARNQVNERIKSYKRVNGHFPTPDLIKHWERVLGL